MLQGRSDSASVSRFCFGLVQLRFVHLLSLSFGSTSVIVRIELPSLPVHEFGSAYGGALCLLRVVQLQIEFVLVQGMVI
jgi:hypothetical protein